MAQETQDLRKRQLALSLDSSRRCLTTSARELRRRLSPAHAAGSYIRRHPVQIFGATTAGVALLTFLFRPRHGGKKSPKSLPKHLFGWIISLAKPAIRAWFLNQAKGYLRSKPTESDSRLGP